MSICFYLSFVCLVSSFNLENFMPSPLEIWCTYTLSFQMFYENYFGLLILHSILSCFFIFSDFFSFACCISWIFLPMYLSSLSWVFIWFDSTIIKYLFLKIHFIFRVYASFFNKSVQLSYFLKQQAMKNVKQIMGEEFVIFKNKRRGQCKKEGMVWNEVVKGRQ